MQTPRSPEDGIDQGMDESRGFAADSPRNRPGRILYE